MKEAIVALMLLMGTASAMLNSTMYLSPGLDR